MVDFDALAKGGWIQLLTELARAYKRITGRKLGITDELGELHACAALDLERAPAGTKGYDATDRLGRRIQVKTRAPDPEKGSSVNRNGTVGRFPTWDFDDAVLVLLDSDYNVEGMWQASLSAVQPRARPRGDIGVSTFIRIAQQVHPKES